MDILILALATWRMSSLLVNEAGPFGVFEKFKQWSLRYTTALECVWCTSVWIAVAMWGIYQTIPVVPVVLAISAGAILVDRWSS